MTALPAWHTKLQLPTSTSHLTVLLAFRVPVTRICTCFDRKVTWADGYAHLTGSQLPAGCSMVAPFHPYLMQHQAVNSNLYDTGCMFVLGHEWSRAPQ